MNQLKKIFVNNDSSLVTVSAGNPISDPQAKWEYGTSEDLINQKFAVKEAEIDEKIDEQDETISGYDQRINLLQNDMIELGDKAYDASTYSGLGRKLLKKNIVGGVNTLTQEMVNDANTIYVIQYDYVLGENITIPENCVLDFEGGSLNTGNITGDGNFIIQGNGFLNGVEILGGCMVIDGALFIPKTATKTSDNAAQIQLFIKSVSNCNAHGYFSDEREIGIASRIYLYSNIDIDFLNCTIYKLDRYANVRTIGMSTETYDTENVTIKNIRFRNENDIRHDCFELVGVKNLIIEGFDYYDAATTPTDSQGNRTSAWATRISGENIIIKNIKIRNYAGAAWADGIHLERCKNVEVYNFDIQSGDDCIAIHEQLPASWTGGYIPDIIENIFVHDGVCKTNMANIIRIGCSNGVSNSFYLSNIHISNIKGLAGETNTFAEIRDLRQSNPTIYSKDIFINNVSCVCKKTNYNMLHITRSGGGHFKNVTFDGLRLVSTGNDSALLYIDGAVDVNFRNCYLEDVPNEQGITVPRIGYIKASSLIIEDSQLVLSGGNTIRTNNIICKNNQLKFANLRQAAFLIYTNNYFDFEGNIIETNGNSTIWNNASVEGEVDMIVKNNIFKNISESTLYFIGGSDAAMKYSQLIVDNNIFNGAFRGNYINNLKQISPNVDGNHFQTGTTANRPIPIKTGYRYFDTTLNKPIYWTDTAWVDAMGNPVDTVYPKVIGNPSTGNFAKFNGTNIEDAGVAPQS